MLSWPFGDVGLFVELLTNGIEQSNARVTSTGDVEGREIKRSPDELVAKGVDPIDIDRLMRDVGGAQ